MRHIEQRVRRAGVAGFSTGCGIGAVGFACIGGWPWWAALAGALTMLAAVGLVSEIRKAREVYNQHAGMFP